MLQFLPPESARSTSRRPMVGFWRKDKWSIDAAHFQQSLDLLVVTGWLEPVGETTKTRRYRLGALARGDRGFEDLGTGKDPLAKCTDPAL